MRVFFTVRNPGPDECCAECGNPDTNIREAGTKTPFCGHKCRAMFWILRGEDPGLLVFPDGRVLRIRIPLQDLQEAQREIRAAKKAA